MGITLDGGELNLTGMVADLRGQRLIRREMMGEPRNAEVMGAKLAEVILESGGDDILAGIYGSS